MSSSPTAPTSTTGSSTSCSSRPEQSPGLTSTTASPTCRHSQVDIYLPRRAPGAGIAFGALGGQMRENVERRGWPVELHFLPSLLHTRPERIPPAAEEIAQAAQARGLRVALAYADCGTYGALDEVCARLGLRRVGRLHRYDVFAGPSRLRALFDAEPGTYVLTDFLVRGFRRSVVAELGLDRHPDLWADYFGHYRRVVWLAQDRTAELEAAAGEVAAMFGLPLTVIDTGTGGLEQELEGLVAGGDRE